MEEEVNYGWIYLFTVSNRGYVGQAVNLKQRFRVHFRLKKPNPYFHNSLRKHFSNPESSFKILECWKRNGRTLEEFKNLLDTREIFWINDLNTFDLKQKNGWNLTKGGGGSLGYIPTEETRNLMGEKRIKYLQEHPEKMKGEYHPWWKRRHLEKTKKLQSEKRIKYLQEHPKAKEKLEGENNPNAKLTKQNVIEIRKLINENKLTRKEIFTHFNISKKQFYRIKNYESWENLK
ncbi:MAG: GIY-YIG nuclease family protein [Patescibacteria group bacterium]